MADENKIIHPGIKDSRVLTYLNLRDKTEYVNTDEENILMQLWKQKYEVAKDAYERSRANSKNVDTWRKAFVGKFKELNSDGSISDKDMKAIRKLAFELVEGKVNARIPAPKMTPRHHADITPVNITEKLLRFESDKMLSEEVNDETEHSVLVDGTVWFKVDWNPFDNTHERSGSPVVKCCPVDTVFPQPGVHNYKDLEYIFEETTITVAQCLDLYGREVRSPNSDDIIPIINVYFLNEDRYVGKFTWCDETSIVICNDLEWGIRKRRECAKCREILPIQDVCPFCGSKDIKYFPVKEEKLKDGLTAISNPYRSGQSPDLKDDENKIVGDIPAGTVIPHYLVRQLPFVPYKRINSLEGIYGISEVEIILEDQDIINKLLNKAERKSAASKTYVTKLKDTHINTKSDEISEIEVESPQEGQSIQVKQVASDINEEITQAQMLYDIAKSTVGVTDTDQGKQDTTARSGKAKQLQLAASAQRNASPETLRNLAFSGVYELIFKYMLAYCDEERRFVSLLPDGTESEEVWSKYMFLAQDEKTNEYYYKDDYAWSVDTATEITQDRASMWQLIQTDFLNGTMGTSIDANRALLMYWEMMDQYGYPTAKYAISFLKAQQKHLPSEVEKALVENPEAVQLALSYLQDRQKEAGLLGGQQGGARPNAGREGNGATHAANVEKTNNTNRAAQGQQTTTSAQALGGMQGGTQSPTEV